LVELARAAERRSAGEGNMSEIKTPGETPPEHGEGVMKGGESPQGPFAATIAGDTKAGKPPGEGPTGPERAPEQWMEQGRQQWMLEGRQQWMLGGGVQWILEGGNVRRIEGRGQEQTWEQHGRPYREQTWDQYGCQKREEAWDQYGRQYREEMWGI